MAVYKKTMLVLKTLVEQSRKLLNFWNQNHSDDVKNTTTEIFEILKDKGMFLTHILDHSNKYYLAVKNMALHPANARVETEAMKEKYDSEFELSLKALVNAGELPESEANRMRNHKIKVDQAQTNFKDLLDLVNRLRTSVQALPSAQHP